MRIIVLLLISLHFQLSFSHTSFNNYKFRLYLKDKEVEDSYKENPLKLLSQKSIDRRANQNVEIDLSDLPVSAVYKNKLKQLGADIKAESKWFNTVVIECKDSLDIEKFADLDFVDSIRYVWKGSYQTNYNAMRPRLKLQNEKDTVYEDYLGITSKQFDFHNAKDMFNAGFRGKGIDVAVIDAGFLNLDVIPSFAHSLISTYKSFVPDDNMFASSDHGTKVFSTMALRIPNRVMGSAPEATYAILRSEDEKSEFPVEEDYWVAAIEYADSIGVNIVNTSLGYNTFDDETLSYKHTDLTGKSSIMSLAADKAFDKGMIVVGSAGNEGNKDWAKITVPGDSRHMLTVGALSLDSVVAPFSSVGPSADGRVKPDFVSVGKATVTIGYTGEVTHSNGTSFSSPFVAGLIASLWSINPELNRQSLIDIVRQSAHQFNNPDSILGYGIPDFKIAFLEVLKTLPLEVNSFDTSLTFGDINKDELKINLKDPLYATQSYSVRVLNNKGELLTDERFTNSTLSFSLTNCLESYENEFYIVVQSPFEQQVIRLKSIVEK